MGTYLQRSISSGGSGTTATFSAWIKTANTPDTAIFTSYIDSNNMVEVYFSSGVFRIYHSSSGSLVNALYTNAVYRDPSAWYHFVCTFDTTNGTEADRLKIYVNGTQVTSFGTANYPTASEDMELNSSSATLNVGARNGDETWQGYMAQVIWIDGTAYSASSFGSTNANGIWVPNTSPSVTYGTNGFKLDFAGTGASADASGFGADTSGNNNHFASSNLVTNPSTKDTPQNNFCTLNSLAINKFNLPTLSQGNLIITDTNNGNWRICGASHGFTSGKWYWETQYIGPAGSLMSGIMDMNNYDAVKVFSTGGDSYPGRYSDSQSFGYRDEGTLYHNGNTTAGKTTWSSAGDILGLAVDMDNKAVYAHVNGTYVDSGDPTSGASRTGSLFNFTPTIFVTPAIAVSAASSQGGRMNFGNAPFTISSSNADANGYGSFEYAVPSGYYALCTKNLATYG